ncbi:MAG: NAD(P)(+) transhydrogenase (Re/Si-specific) subunit beta [Chlamydiota bacterium]
MTALIEITYFFSAILFIVGLKLLGSPSSAYRGNALSSFGMVLAVVATLFHQEIVSWDWIIAGIALGSALGFYCAKSVKMTEMPEMVALLNGLGGLSSLLVGCAFYYENPQVSFLPALSICLSILIGGVTFTGSVIAWAKLCGVIMTRSRTFPGQKTFMLLLLTAALASSVLGSLFPAESNLLYTFLIAGSLILGLLFVLPIGGADMPVVISLLNSYSGLAACASGFVIQNNLLIVSGSLVGASGIILTSIMCKAMNRSLFHVLFQGFFSVESLEQKLEKKIAKKLTPQDAYYLLESARSILIVPGYGLAVAQAQHAVKELSALFLENGAEVRYAIHPVAGRMPGHMNVLLAEAGISYDHLIEMDDINPLMSTIDVCIVIGANDVVNPSAKEDQNSAIYGMPIIEAHQAKQVLVLKRSLASGFAGIENPLFFRENTSMIFGDAKMTLQLLVGELKKK